MTSDGRHGYGAPGYAVDPNDLVLLVAGDGLDVVDVTLTLAGGEWFVFAGEAP